MTSTTSQKKGSLRSESVSNPDKDKELWQGILTEVSRSLNDRMEGGTVLLLGKTF